MSTEKTRKTTGAKPAHKETPKRKTTRRKKPRGYPIEQLIEALEELRKAKVDLSYLAK